MAVGLSTSSSRISCPDWRRWCRGAPGGGGRDDDLVAEGAENFCETPADAGASAGDEVVLPVRFMTINASKMMINAVRVWSD